MIHFSSLIPPFPDSNPSFQPAWPITSHCPRFCLGGFLSLPATQIPSIRQTGDDGMPSPRLSAGDTNRQDRENPHCHRACPPWELRTGALLGSPGVPQPGPRQNPQHSMLATHTALSHCSNLRVYASSVLKLPQ